MYTDNILYRDTLIHKHKINIFFTILGNQAAISLEGTN
jgi:hypothetical protein